MSDLNTETCAVDKAEYTVTERREFLNGAVAVEVQNDSMRFAWRLNVEGDCSYWTTHYQGLLEHKGWFVATAYWEGVLPVMTPFKVEAAK